MNVMTDIEKLDKTTGYLLLKYKNRRLNYTKLIKELYLADKAFLAEANQTITGDSYVCMKNGPVLSQLYDFVKGRAPKDIQSYWNSRFSIDGFELIANFDQFPAGKLSRAEKAVIDNIDGKFHQAGYGDMIDYVHQHNVCPEWSDPEGSSTPIKLEDMLRSVGKTPEEIALILAENETFEEEEKVFKSLAEV
jgi:uncharacterized phage-associated protein